MRHLAGYFPRRSTDNRNVLYARPHRSTGGSTDAGLVYHPTRKGLALVTLAATLRKHVETAYRGLVSELADGAELNPSAAVKILAAVQRTPEQLQADVLRLQSRRRDVEQLAEVERLTVEVEQAQDAYRAAVKKQEASKAELSKAEQRKSADDNLENRKAVNESRRRLSDANDESALAFRHLEVIRKRRDGLRDELTRRLAETAISETDPAVPENFALSGA